MQLHLYVLLQSLYNVTSAVLVMDFPLAFPASLLPSHSPCLLHTTCAARLIRISSPPFVNPELARGVIPGSSLIPVNSYEDRYLMGLSSECANDTCHLL